MPSQAQRPISVYRTIVLAGVTTLLIMSAAPPTSAQNSVPAAASQAERLPKFASRPALPSGRPALPPYVSSARQASRVPNEGGGGVVYENGPIDGNTYAWEIDDYNGLNDVGDTFTLAGSSTITGISFGAWLYPGDALESVQLSISSQFNDFGTIYYFSPPLYPEQSGCVLNQWGFNVCTETLNYLSIPELSPGTYWLNVGTANVSNHDPAFWDQNSGIGCTSPGCPSQAQSNYYGTIPSESFTLSGTTSPPTAVLPVKWKAADSL
jgi:hypothetical protein